MDIEVLREKLKNRYENVSLNEPCDVDKLSNDDILRLAKKMDLAEDTDDDAIEGIPAPIFFDLFT